MSASRRNRAAEQTTSSRLVTERGALSSRRTVWEAMDARTFALIGCYTNESPVGIRVFDASHGSLSEVGELRDVENPSFLAPHPNGTVLYAVSETSNGNGDGGAVVALTLEPATGALVPLQEVKSGGDAPCHLSVDTQGRHLYVANYVSGSVIAYRLQTDGRIADVAFRCRHTGTGPTARQEGPHAHCAVPHPHRSGVVVADLGIDSLVHYNLDGTIEDHLEMAPGSGPRHLTWHPTLPIGFVVGELDNTITIIEIDERSGFLTSSATVSTLPADFEGLSLGAEVRVNRGGTRVYVSNRGHDSIAAFAFADRRLELLAHVPSGGRTPRNFALHPSEDSLVVANQDSNCLGRFDIGPDGVPVLVDQLDEVPEPVCVTFVETDS